MYQLIKYVAFEVAKFIITSNPYDIATFFTNP